MDEDEDVYAFPERFPFIGDSLSYVHALGSEPAEATEVAEHIAAALRIVPLERCLVADGDGYDVVLQAHGRLMMERDLRGLRLPTE